MKPRRSWILFSLGIVLILLGLLIAYRLSDQEKITLDDSVRATLPGQFVKLPLGVVHYELGVRRMPRPSSWCTAFRSLTISGIRPMRRLPRPGFECCAMICTDADFRTD